MESSTVVIYLMCTHTGSNIAQETCKRKRGKNIYDIYIYIGWGLNHHMKENFAAWCLDKVDNGFL